MPEQAGLGLVVKINLLILHILIFQDFRYRWLFACLVGCKFLASLAGRQVVRLGIPRLGFPVVCDQYMCMYNVSFIHNVGC